ncbi:putative methyltransferase PMT18 [Abeliophyllum distichum]|uniref:Methyltransferase n=1 Tax=Abeliophyllum distichum TaxID=126358 RepID=A0ABD1VS20_9LAMI
MAGPIPSKANSNTPKLLSLVLVIILSSVSYTLGVWKRGGPTTSASTSSLGVTIPCIFPRNTTNPKTHLSPTTSSAITPLDFTSHHSADDGGATTSPDETIKKYPPCSIKYSEYTPLSRDLVWYANVPHKELTVEKAVQNWIRYEDDRFRFPGGGTMFPHGADAYIDDIGKLINLKDGSIRTAIDTGCGVASWGAFLLSRNILPISFAPRDSHEAQVQFALERGVPALIGIMASKRLPYPSRAFDMAHCSRCLIPWGQYDGLYLIEVDRILRPGGYWILSGPPIRWRKYWKGWQRSREDLNAEQTQIENVTKSLCWKKLVEKDDLAIWQKPTNHLHCKKIRKSYKNLPLCSAQDPDKAWYTNLETCLTPLPDVSNNQEVAGGELEKWPRRLNAAPPRISLGTISGSRSRLRSTHSGVIYERGLIGTYQSWCEAMSTYPRTYDLIHADSVFTLYKDRCEMEDILLEMDRILRPEGSLIIRDDVDILVKVKRIADGLNWDSQIVNHENGPFEREKVLFVVKLYWTAPASADQQGSKSS